MWCFYLQLSPDAATTAPFALSGLHSPQSSADKEQTALWEDILQICVNNGVLVQLKKKDNTAK